MPRSAIATDPVLDAVENDCLQIILNQRAALPHAANGQPKAQSDDYAAQVRKEMIAGRSREIRRLFAVLRGDVRDGVSSEEATLVLRRLIAGIEQEAKGPRPRPVSAWNRAETRQDCLVDLSQLRVEATPDDPDALSEGIQQIARYRALLDDFQSDLERRLVAVQTAHLMPQITRSDVLGARHLALVTDR